MVLLGMPIGRDYFLRPRPSCRFGKFEAVRAMVADGHSFTSAEPAAEGRIQVLPRLRPGTGIGASVWQMQSFGKRC